MKPALAKLLDKHGKIMVKEQDGDDPPIFAEPGIDIDPDMRCIGFWTEDTWLFSISLEDIRAIADWIDEIADSLEEMKDVD